MDATAARDAALTVPTAATSASFDLLIMAFLPLTGRSGHHAFVARPAAQIGSVSGVFNRGILERTVHDDEMVERDGRQRRVPIVQWASISCFQSAP
jgi:hypothetical protein